MEKTLNANAFFDSWNDTMFRMQSAWANNFTVADNFPFSWQPYQPHHAIESDEWNYCSADVKKWSKFKRVVIWYRDFHRKVNGCIAEKTKQERTTNKSSYGRYKGSKVAFTNETKKKNSRQMSEWTGKCDFNHFYVFSISFISLEKCLKYSWLF